MSENHEMDASKDSSGRFTGTNVVARFRVGSRLGGGGMGEVYLAEDTLLKRSVALKTIVAGHERSAKERSRLRHEARKASVLSHPNIAAIHDLIETDDYVFIVMEYVSGQSLRARLKAPMSVADALQILFQCAEGLGAAHVRGIVHGDIKPENIMLTGAGNVKICDFGIAKTILPASDGSTTEIDAGKFVGTPAYMAPELLLGGQSTVRSDLFALGVTAYEVIAGWNFFDGGGIPATSDRILNRVPPPLRYVAPGLPASVERVIFNMLEKDARNRTDSVAGVIASLRDAMTGSNVEAVEATVPARAPRKRSASNLVVLPFTSIGGDADAQFYCDGLIETLNARLTRLSVDSPLQLISSTDRQNPVRSVEEARRRLGADIVLMGTLQRADPQVRVNYFLVDAGSNLQLFAESITGEYSSPFLLQDRVFEGVASALRLNSSRGAHSSQARRPGAAEFYVQARGYLQNYDRKENLDSAEKLLRKALAVDPNYAAAYAGLGETYWRNFELSKALKWIEPAREACTEALRISPELPEGHACLGLISNGTGDHDRAVVEFRQALSSDPTNDAYYTGLAKAFEALGKNEDAEKTYLQAIQLRPQYWVAYGTLGVYYFKTGNFRRALEMFQHVATLAPDSTRGHSNLGAVLFKLGRMEEAIAAYEESMRLEPNYRAASNLGTLYFYEKNDFEKAVELFREALKLNDQDHVVWANLGAALKWMGNDEFRNIYPRAIAIAETLLELDRSNPELIGALAEYHAVLDHKEESLRLLKNAFELAPNNAALMYRAACLHGHNFKQTDQAFEWLGRAVNAGYPWKQIEKTPALAELRDDSRFDDIRRVAEQSERTTPSLETSTTHYTTTH